MRIAFLGDSITQGLLGVSFVDIVQDRLPNTECINHGLGGDTVHSLLKRIKRMEDLHTYDVFVLLVGINDLYGKINWQHSLTHVVLKQKMAKNKVAFKRTYNELLHYLLQFKKKLIVIPPLLIGEDLSNSWNQKVDKYANIVQEQATFFKEIHFIDARNICVERLQDKKTVPFIGTSIFRIKKDLDTLTTNELIDSKSKERGLYLTLDGVHINSITANILAREIIHTLQRLK